MHNNKIRKIIIDQSIKTLGLYLNPTLKQNDKFEYVRKKMNNSTTKLIRTNKAVWCSFIIVIFVWLL